MPPSKKDIEAPSEEHISHAKRDSGSNSDGNTASYDEKQGRRQSSTALLKNPLTGMSREDILADVDAFVDEKGLSEHREAFRKGALVAQVANVDNGFESIPDIDETEKEMLRRETTNRWSQPFTLYFLCTLCAGSAIVQGMDQTAVNGAQVSLCQAVAYAKLLTQQVYYYETFNITSRAMQGLMNGAPYLCSALVGCWTNPVLNKIGGRRFTIFFSCLMSVITGFWMAVADS